MSVLEAAQQLFPQMQQWRRHLHQFPELSFAEVKTQAFILGTLKEMGLAPEPVAQTGVMVDVGRGPGGVAIRADIDALPLTEESGWEYSSRHPGIMHACGHDGHTAILLGVASLLADAPANWPGRVRLFFQPAEEKIPGGAQAMIDAGVLQGMDRVLGLHLASHLPTGTVGAVTGAQTANADTFRIEIEGRGGHGSAPHQAIDPIVVASEFVMAAQSIVSRNTNPMCPAVVTIGTIEAGSNFNIIAPRAQMTGTVRTFSADDRELIRSRLNQLLTGIAAAHGAQAELEYTNGYPSVVNSPWETACIQEVTERLLGSHAWQTITPSMAGEDFSYYQHVIPGTFFMLGCGNTAVGSNYPHHHPRFTIDEAAMPYGTAILLESAREFLLYSNPSTPKEGEHT